MFVVFSFVYLLFFILYMCCFLHCYCFFTVRFEWKPPEPQFTTYVKICAKYARAKNERKTSANPPDTFEASFRTEAPDSAADRASRSPKPVGVVVHRSSFVVPSFVVYRRLVSVVLCSLVGLVVCLAHNTIAAMSPSPSRWLRLCCSSLTSLASHLLHSLLPLWRFQCQASSC